MEYDVCCLHPIWIRNPKWYDAVMTMDHLVYLGRDIYVSSFRRSRIYFGESLYKVFGLRYIADPNHDARLSSYFYRESDGFCLSFFVQVPCGKCAACRQIYHNGLLQRASFACEESSGDPLFVTLTYNTPHLPKNHLPCYDHVVKFKKRLSRLVSDMTGSNPKYFLKYFAFAEIGKDGRPHYHMLIFNFPNYRGLGYTENMFKTQMINYCWRDPERHGKHFLCFSNYLRRGYRVYNQKPGAKDYDNRSFGFVNLSVVDNSKAAAYVSKYVSKYDDHDSDEPVLFKCVSQNLGVKFVQERFNYAFNAVDRKLQYLSRFGGMKSVGLHSYYVNKMLPSQSVKFPALVRRAISHIVYGCTFIKDHPRLFHKNVVHNSFLIIDEINEKLPFYPIQDFYTFDDRQTMDFSPHECVSLVDRFVGVLNSYLSNPVDMAPSRSRDLYFRNLEFKPGDYAIIVAKKYKKDQSSLIASSYI